MTTNKASGGDGIPIELFQILKDDTKVMLKILQVKFQQCVNKKLSDIQPGYGKGRGTRGQLVKHLLDYRKGKRIKNKSTSVSLTLLKSLTMNYNKLENSLKK